MIAVLVQGVAGKSQFQGWATSLTKEFINPDAMSRAGGFRRALDAANDRKNASVITSSSNEMKHP
jgi:uncharacterized protein YyaL (SSP411 family)